MAQDITQNVEIVIKTTGLEAATKKLEALESSIKERTVVPVKTTGAVKQINNLTKATKDYEKATKNAAKTRKQILKQNQKVLKKAPDKPTYKNAYKTLGKLEAVPESKAQKEAYKLQVATRRNNLKEFEKLQKELSKPYKSRKPGVSFSDYVKRGSELGLLKKAKPLNREVDYRGKTDEEIKARRRNPDKHNAVPAIANQVRAKMSYVKKQIREEEKLRKQAEQDRKREIEKTNRELKQAGEKYIKHLKKVNDKRRKIGLKPLPITQVSVKGYHDVDSEHKGKIKHINQQGDLGTIRTIQAKPTSEKSGTKLIKGYRGIDRVRNSVNSLHASTQKASKSMRSFGESLGFANKKAEAAMFNFFRTRAIIAAIASAGFIAGGFVKNWFDLASDYAEANHLFYTTLASSMRDISDAEKSMDLHAKDVFGNELQEVLKVTPAIYDAAMAVEKFASDMALDPTSVKRTYANFYELAVSAGVSYDKIATLSQGMTQLTYDLASLNDLPFEDVQQKLASGLSGVTSAVRSLGPDISRTAADAWLLANGFDTTYNALTRNNKMIVIYNMLMENTITAQGDLARSALQPANAMRLLSEQSRVAARSLGGAVFPVVTQLIPVFIVLAQAIQRAAAALATFFTKHFGGENGWYAEELKNWNSYLKGLNQGFGGGGGIADDMTEDLDGVGGAADKAGKKLKELRDFQLGFDELHLLPNQPTDTGGGGTGGGGTGGGGGGIDIPIADAYEPGEGVLDAITKDAEATMARIKNSIDNLFDPGTVDAFTQAVKTMYDTTIKNAEKLWEASEPLRTFIDEHWDWVEALNALAQGYNNTMNLATSTVSTLLKAIEPLLDLLTKIPVVGPIFEFLIDHLDSSSFYLLGMWFAAKLMLKPFKIMGKIFSPAIKGLTKFKDIIKGIGKAIPKLVGKLGTFIGKFEKLGGVAKKVPKIFEKLPKAISAAFGKIKPLLKKLFKGGNIGKMGLVAKTGLKGTPIGPLLIAVDAIPAIVDEFKQAFDDIKRIFTSEDPIGEFANIMKERWGSGHFVSFVLKALGLESLVDDWERIWGKIANSETIENIVERVTEGFDSLKTTTSDIWDKIKETVKGAIVKIGDAIMSIVGIFCPDLKEAWEQTREKITGESSTMSDNVVDDMGTIKKDGGSKFSEFTQGLKTKIEDAKKSVTDKTDKIKIAVKSKFSDIKEKAGSTFSTFTSGVGSKIKTAYDTVKDKVTGMKDTVVNKTKGINTSGSSYFDAFKNSAKSKFGSIKYYITQYMNTAKSSANSDSKAMYDSSSGRFGYFSKMLSATRDSFRSIYNNVRNYSNLAKDAFGSNWNIPYIKLPHFTWDIKRVGPMSFPVNIGLSWYKTGGIFDGPSMIGVGEAGPEAVVPLSTQRMKPFAKAVSDNISYSRNDIDADIMAEKISIAVYNAMIKGFPKDIKSTVYLDGTKVNDELRRNDSIRGNGKVIVV